MHVETCRLDTASEGGSCVIPFTASALYRMHCESKGAAQNGRAQMPPPAPANWPGRALHVGLHDSAFNEWDRRKSRTEDTGR